MTVMPSIMIPGGDEEFCMKYKVQINVGIAEVEAENADIAMGKAIEAVQDMASKTENITLRPEDIYEAYASQLPTT